MKFVDEVTITVKAGDGGRPCVTFLREKYRPFGGPSGGDGGNGGDVILRADPGLGTLLDYQYQSRIEAKRGEHGRGKTQHGRRGDDVVARVPVGTVVTDVASSELLADLVEPGQEATVARGGRGGLGNARFATSTHQAPRESKPAMPGEERQIRLELRLLADVGIVGFPNVGKSTLIRAISAARPKVADYPFTTLVPNLGVVRVGEESSFVVADVPGLIAGAHRGEGLGDRFLRHLSRTSLLVHVLDLSPASGRDPLEDFAQVNRELALHDETLAARAQIVVANKLDLAEARARLPEVKRALGAKGIEVLSLSAATGEGVRELVSTVWHALVRHRRTTENEARLGRPA
jgi:GTPase